MVTRLTPNKLLERVLATMKRRIELMIATGVAGNGTGDPRFGDFWMTVIRQRLLRDLQFIHSYAQASDRGLAEPSWRRGRLF